MVNLGFTEQEKAILDKPFASEHPHVFLNKEDGIRLEVDAWIKAGRPHVLVVVARSANYTGVMDTGYGKMFLLDTNTDEMSQALNHTAVLNNAVFLDKRYYGTNSHLFISDEAEEYAVELGNLFDLIQDKKLAEAEQLLDELGNKLSPNCYCARSNIVQIYMLIMMETERGWRRTKYVEEMPEHDDRDEARHIAEIWAKNTAPAHEPMIAVVVRAAGPYAKPHYLTHQTINFDGIRTVDVIRAVKCGYGENYPEQFKPWDSAGAMMNVSNNDVSIIRALSCTNNKRPSKQCGAAVY